MVGVLTRHLDTFDRFIHGRLPANEWTHEAHLITCWVALQERTAAQALPFLRTSIQTHNCGIGTPNTETEGYHETLTVYYVTAVANAAAPDPETLSTIPSCDRHAPLTHWDRDTLFSVPARLGWLAPNLVELPWPVTPTLGQG